MDTLPTRSYIQDLARVLGKAQQTYLPPEPHEWHRGLQVVAEGLRTAPLSDSGSCLTLDMSQGTIRADESLGRLGDITAASLMKKTREWLLAHDIDKEPDEPELSGETGYQPGQLAYMHEALQVAAEALESAKESITTGLTSPVLLYPHHLDISLTWFPYQDDRQLSFGFSFGDEHIAGPYFYSSAYPEPDGFAGGKLPEGAYWHDKGFRGAVLPYEIVQRDSDPHAKVTGFCKTVMTQARDNFET